PHGVPAHVPRPQRARGCGQPPAIGRDVGGAVPGLPGVMTAPRGDEDMAQPATSEEIANGLRDSCDDQGVMKGRDPAQGGSNRAGERWTQGSAAARPLATPVPNRLLAAEVSGLPPGRALDLACGAGRNAVWLAERGWRVTAVDFPTAALTIARDLARA